jgi:hypothetical protein
MQEGRTRQAGKAKKSKAGWQDNPGRHGKGGRLAGQARQAGRDKHFGRQGMSDRKTGQGGQEKIR